jgi:hypothetical protein
MRSFARLFLLLLLLIADVASGQTFTASVDNTTVGVNDQFQVTFTFSGTDINGIKSFNPPDFHGFMVLSGPNQSTSMQIINGSVSASASYSYYLRPHSVGKFTIGSASINYNGKIFSTQPLAINVVKESQHHSASSGKSSGEDQSATLKNIGDNLFILATADKQKVYLGEQVIVTYKLYTRLGIASQMQISKLPSYQGFWAEEINTPNSISFATEMYHGRQFRVGVLKKVALFPSQTGELSVTPLVLDVPVQIQNRRNSNDIFDQFFNDPFFNSFQTVNYTAKSNTIRLHVIPLPDKDVPKSFNGAVGDYSISSQISSTTVKANEPLTLKVNISGRGNIQLLNMPEINLPSGFDKYEPKTSEQIDRNGTISGTKSFDYLIIPRSPGSKEIPPIQFSFFNPEKRSYTTLTTPSYIINVTPGAILDNQIAAGYSKEEIKVLGQDIRYIKTSTDDLRREGDGNLGIKFWTATILPVVLLGGIVAFKKRRDKLEGDVQLLRYRRAEKVARKRFKVADDFMKANDQAGFYAEISQALFGYLEDKLHIPKSEISLEKAVDILKAKGIDGGLIESLRSCIEKCEFARFAPSANGAEAMKNMYRDLTSVVIELEKSLSAKRYI